MAYYFQPPIFAVQQQPMMGVVYAAPQPTIIHVPPQPTIIQVPPQPTQTVICVPVPTPSNAAPPPSPPPPPPPPPRAPASEPQQRAAQEALAAPPGRVMRVVFQSHDEAHSTGWFRYGDLALPAQERGFTARVLRAQVAILEEQVGFGLTRGTWDQDGGQGVVLYKLRRGVALRLARDSNRCAGGPSVLSVFDQGFGAAMLEVLRGVEWDAEAVFLVIDVSSQPRVVDEAVVVAAET
ncbi:hypothetical protein CDD81_2538 [Ophiocordyceps australis]|uniref:Uncharacterized protein n=1 Tax=Ophiocordyceps australis TaxID=1399860 RepID=A0A2C5YEM7_9HYPO|nr:hypothetical protein CDD81_2538 [Ophiocordyceps australis]